MVGIMGRRGMLGATLAAAAVGRAAAQQPVKVASIYTVPLEQQWVSRLHAALKTAEARKDVTYKWSESIANNDYERVLRGYAEEGADLIVGEIFGVERAVRRVAATYPKVAFLMGSSFGPSKPNLSVFDNFIQEPSYLTGMIAGRATKTGTIGMVGGFAIPEVNRLMQAFMEGARSTNPQVKFLISFIGSWYDPPKAKEAAFAMTDKGADVLYAERFGVTDAAKERGLKVVGNVVDTAAQYSGTVLASALWHMEPTMDRAIKAVREQRWEAVDYGQFSQMQYGGASLSLDETLVPPDVVKLVRDKEREIVDGLFRVNVNDAEPKPS